MNTPLWKLLELTIRTQLKGNVDEACNTLDSFINTHVYANPSYKEQIEIIRKLNGMLKRINIEPTKQKEKELLKSYERY